VNEQPIFDHEKLDVHQIGLLFIAWSSVLLAVPKPSQAQQSEDNLVMAHEDMMNMDGAAIRVYISWDDMLADRARIRPRSNTPRSWESS
jgi:hypothetical protein